MSTNNFVIGYAQERSCERSFSKAIADRLAVAGLSFSFFLSFTQYCFERSDLVRLVPFATLVSLSIFLFALSVRENRREILTAVFRPGNIALIAAVCVPSLISSLYRQTSYPFQYGVAMLILLFAVRALLSEIGPAGLLRAYLYGTTAGMFLVVALSLTDLANSIGSTRYAPLFYDPNRIAFFAVTAIPVQLWMATNKSHRRFVLLGTALCLIVMAAASSRGSIGALIISSAVASSLYLGKRWMRRPFVFSRAKLIAILGLLCTATVGIGAKLSAVDDAGGYILKKLAIEDRERGVLDSGFTGRTGFWHIVMTTLPKTPWMFGNGYRTSEEDFNFAVDNGYLASVYELGAVATVLIVAKFAFSCYELASAYKRLGPGAAGIALTLVFTLIAFFANGFVHRVLFGYGDPASILALFVFLGTRRDLDNLAAFAA